MCGLWTIVIWEDVILLSHGSVCSDQNENQCQHFLITSVRDVCYGPVRGVTMQKWVSSTYYGSIKFTKFVTSWNNRTDFYKNVCCWNVWRRYLVYGLNFQNMFLNLEKLISLERSWQVLKKCISFPAMKESYRTVDSIKAGLCKHNVKTAYLRYQILKTFSVDFQLKNWLSTQTISLFIAILMYVYYCF